MLINVGISTGTMCKKCPFLRLYLESMKKNHPNALSPTHGFPDRERLRLQRFISAIRIHTTHLGPDGQKHRIPRVLKKLSFQAHLQYARAPDYFRRTQNKPLQFPDVIYTEVGSGALTPLGQYILSFISSISLPDLRHGCQLRYGPPQGAGLVLKPSMLNYGPGFRQLPITPGDGACNMVEKKFFKAVANERWVVVVYEQQWQFNDQSAQDVISFAAAAAT
ncbi:hypothetical protein K438DRAFT_145347 [Mycena galopus ATCC 62051]|nr:hypothetical protein K438DRAFT_145347 [Mycena galopus ATCC 62051]